MRQKLNENPVAQIAVIGVLVLIVGLFLMKSMGGGSSKSGGGATATATESGSTETSSGEESGGSLEEATPAAATSGVSAPAERALPKPLEDAYQAGDTVVLLIYRPGGIDDRRLTEAASVLHEMPGVDLFTAPAKKVARYSAITGPLGVNQAPALIVVRSRKQNGSSPAPATVDYGFRTRADIRQAVIDAGYQGPQLSYAPN